MSIRPARFTDVKVLVDMLVEQHPRTIYAALSDVNIDYARKLLAQMVNGQGKTHNGGSCVFVAETGEGVIEAFVAGALSPIYMIGTRLVAQDLFLIARQDASPRAAMKLIDAYVEWASAIPKVCEIQLSHLDSTPEASRVGHLYKRKGFVECGQIFRRFVNIGQDERAAA